MTPANDHNPLDVTGRLTAAQRRLAEAFRKRMMTVLLVLLLFLVFVIPAIVQNQVYARLLIDVILSFILLTGTLTVLQNRPLLLLLGSSSVIALLLRWSEWVVPLGFLPIVRDVSVMLTLLVMAVAVGITVFGKNADIEDRVVGAVVLYLLIGIVHAVAYYLINIADPTAFNAPPESQFPLTTWIYFSFVTLTTVGYGDITPVTRLPRTIAMLQALIGQLYPAVILARLVALPRA